MATVRQDVTKDQSDVETLLEVIDSMAPAEGSDVAIRRLAWIALRATSADRCGIFALRRGEEPLLNPKAGASKAGDLSTLWEQFRTMEPIRFGGELRRLLDWGSSEAIAIEDVERSPLMPGAWHRVWGSTSVVLAPIRAGGELIGLLAVDRVGDALPFGDREVRLLEAIAVAAGLALRGARVVDQLQTRIRLIESLYRLSDAVAETTDLKVALATLNRDVCSGVGVECVRLSLADPALAVQLRVPKATRDELALIRAWRRADHPEPQWEGDEASFPVTMGRRQAGILHVRAHRHLEEDAIALVGAIAAGLGEVTLKAKLRRTAERRAQELAIAADRERIARDLHDTVGQKLHQIDVKLQECAREADDPRLLERLNAIRAQAVRGVADIRSAVYALSFLHVRERGFLPSIRAVTRRFMIGTDITTEMRVDGPIPALGEDIEGALYRVVQEALVNVERHGRATGVVVSLSVRDDMLELSIRDDGVGLSHRDGGDWRSSAHFGIRSMNRAIESVGGRFHIARAHPRGLLIRATVPVPRGVSR